MKKEAKPAERKGVKSTGKPAGLSQAAGDLLVRLLGPASVEIGDYLAERMKIWRWKKSNFEKIAKEVEDELQRRGVEPDSAKPLPEGDAYKAIEACALEDDDTVQKLWAGLIASAMDPSRQTNILKAYIDILQSIGPQEVGLLLLINEIETSTIDPDDQSIEGFNSAHRRHVKELTEFAQQVWRRYPKISQDVAIQNLMRLRCIGLRTGRRLGRRQLLSTLGFGARAQEIAINADFASRAFEYLEDLIMASTGSGSRLPSPTGLSLFPGTVESLPEATYALTALGRSLIEACLHKPSPK